MCSMTDQESNEAFQFSHLGCSLLSRRKTPFEPLLNLLILQFIDLEVAVTDLV